MMQKENKRQDLKYLKIMLKKNSLLNRKIQQLKLELFELRNSQKLLTVDQLKEIYGISRSTLERYRKKGLKVNQPIMNGRIFICPIELEKFLKTKKKW